MTDRIDTLVIGSGFGGAVVAHRLAAAGERVTLLERGPWRDTTPLAGLPSPTAHREAETAKAHRG